jgi:cation diffusion facilitator CzcD-associated flavoprotein CzcO
MPNDRYDIVIVGAGFAGMYMLHRARLQGLTARVYETGDGVGGTWYWNRYPGARCDVESMQYSYQFDDKLQQDWDWSERYSPQPEILRYANHVADRFDLRRDIQFETRVTAAHYDEASGTWKVETNKGDKVTSRWVVMATGCLSATNKPAFKGVELFKGPTYHTGQWPHEEVDFTGKRVAVIGTGSSAIQSIPVIAQQAKHLTVFQRTANYTVPAHNQPLAPEYKQAIKADYKGLRERARKRLPCIDMPLNDVSALATPEEQRRREYEKRWEAGGIPFMGAFNDLLFNDDSNKTAAEFVKEKIRETVKDPKLAELLSPTNIIGCKRLCVDTDYWKTFNSPHVELVDVSKDTIEITAKGVKVAGREFEVDAIVYAIGFDAMTGALLRVDIRGKGGRKLKDKWTEGPKAYLGLSIAGFPNLFTVTGPGSPSVLTNMLPSIEQHVEFIDATIAWMRKNEKRTIEASGEAEEKWVEHVGDVAGHTLRSTCSSWYVGANVPGKPRVFMPYIGGFPAYVEKCNDVVAKGYDGFIAA